MSVKKLNSIQVFYFHVFSLHAIKFAWYPTAECNGEAVSRSALQILLVAVCSGNAGINSRSLVNMYKRIEYRQTIFYETV